MRIARGWSQEEVARRMDAFGYDFHQTMIAKIEAAQRPLRVRELADFAALFGVPTQEVLNPVGRDWTTVTAVLQDTRKERAEAATAVEEGERDVRQAQARLDQARRALAEADTKLAVLSAMQADLVPSPPPLRKDEP